MNAQPHRFNRLLRLSYRFVAPLYDCVVEGPMRAARRRSLQALPLVQNAHILISGVGTGLDLPLLPRGPRYTALDFSMAMLARAQPRTTGLEISFVLGDSMALPFADASFDHIVLHLILAVVPEPQRCLSESARVLKPGGTILLIDKFLRPQQRAPLRRLLNVFTRHFATRLDVIFEDVLRATPRLEVASDDPLLAHGWLRCIRLRKAG